MFPKRGAIALVTTVLGLVLLFSFKTPDMAAVDATVQSDGSAGTGTASTPSSTAGTGSGGATAPSASASTSASAAAAATAAATTVTGTTVSTRYGDVAVEVTVANGAITAVQAVTLPSGGRSGEISAYAGPILASEALSAQSSSIDIVSGATYTSRAYAQSLQAALDQAGIGSTTVNG